MRCLGLLVSCAILMITIGCAGDKGGEQVDATTPSGDAGPAPPPMRDGEASDVDGSDQLDGGDPRDAANDANADPDTGDSGSAEALPLPPGSVEIDNIVNFVDEAAAAELDAFLQAGGAVHVALRQGLAKSANLFLEHYEEQYDFLFVFTDHSLPSGVIGKFEAVNREAKPGTGHEIEIAAGGYKTTGRLRGVVGVQWRTPVGPPLSHEIMHYWAVGLDERLGFGAGLGVSYLPHWGFTSVHGQLGGYDASTLRCETPEGAMPPSCTALPSGRFRHVVGSFYPTSNPPVPYASLELYLMGLMPASEVQATFDVLDQAEEVDGSFDPDAATIVVEADGISQIDFADVLARHGEVALRDADERSFSAAFIVVSSAPATAEVLQDVAEWAAAFGNRGTSPVVTPFETLTGDRATLNTELGPRRNTSSVVPEARVRFECDVLEQDCPRAELGCYGPPASCALSGSVAEGTSCDAMFACAPGFDCYSGPGDPAAYVCTPYCDPSDDAAPLACMSLCPGEELSFLDEDDVPIGAVCLP